MGSKLISAVDEGEVGEHEEERRAREDDKCGRASKAVDGGEGGLLAVRSGNESTEFYCYRS